MIVTDKPITFDCAVDLYRAYCEENGIVFSQPYEYCSVSFNSDENWILRDLNETLGVAYNNGFIPFDEYIEVDENVSNFFRFDPPVDNYYEDQFMTALSSYCRKKFPDLVDDQIAKGESVSEAIDTAQVQLDALVDEKLEQIRMLLS